MSLQRIDDDTNDYINQGEAYWSVVVQYIAPDKPWTCFESVNDNAIADFVKRLAFSTYVKEFKVRRETA